MKVTEWFPNDVKPAYPGVYEKDFEYCGKEYQYWDGKRWHYGCSTPQKTLIEFVRSPGGNPIPRRWRGVK